MAKDISIGIASETRGFQKGINDGVIEPLEGAVDAIEELGKQGDDSGEQLTDAMKDAQKKTELLGDEYVELRKKIDQVGKQGSDSWKKVKASGKDAESGMQDFKEEANSTAKESAASFDGSAQSIVDSFQEIAANAFAGFGAAGAVAGLALAAGIGIATAEFQKSEEEAKKAKERIADLGQAMIDAGTKGERPLEEVISSLQDIVTNSDDAVKKFQDIQRASKFVGTSAEKMAAAYAGNKDALEGQLDVINDLIEKEQEQVDKQADHGSRFAAIGQAKVGTLKQQQAELKKVQEETAAAAAIEQAYLASGGAEMLTKQGMIDAINTSYDDLAGSVTDFLNQETGLFDTEAYITAMQQREQSLKDYQETLTTSGLSTDAMNFLNDQGFEAASQMLAGYQSASPETKAELNRIWTEASKEASGSVSTELDKTINKKRTAKIDAHVDSAAAESALEQVIRDRTAQIRVEYVDRYGKKVD